MIGPQQEPRQADLAGEYGDVFWSLPPSMVYAAGSEINCRMYVANPTEVDREYMLMATLSRGGEVISEFPIKVDEAVWFPVQAGNVVGLPGALVLGYTDCALTAELYERETDGVADSVSTALTAAGTANLPVLPGVPSAPSDTGGLMGMVVMVMAMGMMVAAMGRAVR